MTTVARSRQKVRALALETERFRLIPIRPLSLAISTLHWTKDSDLFVSLGWRASGWTPRRWWRHLRHQVRGNRICHGIWPKSGGPCIGLHMTSVSQDAQTAGIGVVIGERDWWGKGVVTEAREAIVGDIFERLKMERVWAQVWARNLPSVYNHRRLGFIHEGTMRSAAVEADGTRVDVLIFAMLRTEWLARKNKSGANDP